MTQSQNLKEDALKKWAPILDRVGVTGSKADWMSQYIQSGIMSNTSSIPTSTSNPFESSLLPMSMKIASQTIAMDLVSVQPIGGVGSERLKEIEKEVKSTNRDRIIDSVIEDKEYEEMKVEDHPDFKKGMPSGQLFYLDYQFSGSTQSGSKKRK